MTLSKTGVLAGVIIFYTILIVMVGFWNYTTIEYEQTSVGSGVIGFSVGNVVKGFVDLPFWINSIIFGSLGLILGWIILSSLPTFSGGS